jgi:hypothetical protein
MPRRYGASATLMTTSIASEEIVKGTTPTMVSEGGRDRGGGEKKGEIKKRGGGGPGRETTYRRGGRQSSRDLKQKEFERQRCQWGVLLRGSESEQ